MNETEWLTCQDPQAMLVWLRSSGKGSERKLRLFAVAWGRRAWNLLGPAGSQRAVETSESFADGLATALQLAEAQQTALQLEPTRLIRVMPWSKAFVRYEARRAVALVASANIAEVVDAVRYSWVMTRKLKEVQELTRKELAVKACLLRCMFGNPFRPATLLPSAHTWNGGTAVHLAQGIYDERELPSGRLDNARLAVLGDALEEAGCTNQEMLEHCRGGGDHWRGCFVIDAVLQRE